MHKTRFIILNGPPGSGKTTIARELARELNTMRDDHGYRDGVVVKNTKDLIAQDSFAAPMKHFIATALGEKYADMNKDRVYPELNGHTPREFLIHLAENHIKALYGQDVFGRWLVHRVLRFPAHKPLYCIIDDGGFAPEMQPVPNKCIVQVYREGKTFAGDSRGYVMPDKDVPATGFQNNGTLCDLWEQVKALAVIVRDERSFSK